MKIIKNILTLLIISFSVSSCLVVSRNKTEDYYVKHKKEIQIIRNLYDNLYAHQPFAVGFTDRSFKYFVLEISTDTLRYTYDNEQSEEQLYQAIHKFTYNTKAMRELVGRMKRIKCLWLDKTPIYQNEKKDMATYFSFKSTFGNKPFVENKFYVLAFLETPIEDDIIKRNLRNSSFTPISDRVYFTISSQFR